MAKYRNTTIGTEKQLKRASMSTFFKGENFLNMENQDYDLIEIFKTPRRVVDDKPIVMAAAILENSKLHFLKFIYEVVFRFFIPGTFRLCYADTDSMCIGKFRPESRCL